MGGKIDELLRLAETGIKSEIINITKEKILEKSLTNQKVVKRYKMKTAGYAGGGINEKNI